VEGQTIAEIGPGVVILLGVGPHDTEEQARYLAEKIANLRIFEDDQGKINLSLLEVGGAALVVSQFTLYADTRKGRRPSFTGAALPELARPLVERFAELLRAQGVPAQTGQFGAHMLVEIPMTARHHLDGREYFALPTASPQHDIQLHRRRPCPQHRLCLLHPVHTPASNYRHAQTAQRLDRRQRQREHRRAVQRARTTVRVGSNPADPG
jgi:D-tyrosyl-tRNA(Tyr) deacylase